MTRRKSAHNYLSAVIVSCSISCSVAFLLSLAAQPANAIGCQVVHHDRPSDADRALLAADYPKAVDLYQATLISRPNDPQLIVGLVHALLRQQKVQQAADIVQAALPASPKSPMLTTLRGEVEFRQGEPAKASDTVIESLKLDECNPRARLLLSKIAEANSLHATARREILTAHQLDPEDPEIRLGWLNTLPLQQRVSELEAYLAAPNGDDAEEIQIQRIYLDDLSKQITDPHKACHLASPIHSSEIPFIRIMQNPFYLRGYGLEVKVNDRAARLLIDTGAGGLLISRDVANHAGLKVFSKTSYSGIGNHGSKTGYTAYADSIRIGNLEFRDCQIDVLDSQEVTNVDGVIGMDAFSQFLVTLDYPMQKLVLGPLPPRPGEVAAAPGLRTDRNDLESDDSGLSLESSPLHDDAAAVNPIAHGAYDRYIAPEMKSYTPVYRKGHLLILPADLNGQALKLFILDTGAWATTISPEAAREVTKVHPNDTGLRAGGISGKVDKLYTTDEITFHFANMSEKTDGVFAFDTSYLSKHIGMEISGFLGASTLRQLTIHIDYRDGLVKFDYNRALGYRNQWSDPR